MTLLIYRYFEQLGPGWYDSCVKAHFLDECLILYLLEKHLAFVQSPSAV